MSASSRKDEAGSTSRSSLLPTRTSIFLPFPSKSARRGPASRASSTSSSVGVVVSRFLCVKVTIVCSIIFKKVFRSSYHKTRNKRNERNERNERSLRKRH